MMGPLRGLLGSFRYAGRGVLYCICNERNMRIHLTTACYIAWFSRYFGLSKAQFALMLCAIALVIAMEMMNTAVEALVNLKSPAYDSLARIAKDIAAGAVLVCAAFALAIGLLFFWQPQVLWGILSGMWTSPLRGFLFLLSLVISALFIFAGPLRILRWCRFKRT